MKNLQYIAFFIILAAIGGCKKNFLEVPDKTTLLRQAYVTDIASTEQLVNGIYVELSANFFDGKFLLYPDVIADNLKTVTGSTSYSTHYGWNQLANSDNSSTFNPISAPNCNGLWYSGYKIIRDCDFILESVDKYRKENPAKADNLKGQALAIRAMLHFYLVNTFAQPYNFTPGGSHIGIPYIKSSEWAAPISRQSVAEVYRAMTEDLQSAILLLPSGTTDTRYFNRNAAIALLARVQLFKGDYLSAKNLATMVGAQFPIMSVAAGYPDAVYRLLPASQTESLFQLPPSTTAAPISGKYSTFFAGYYFNTPVVCVATSDIASILKENNKDVRSNWVVSNSGLWNVKKYPVNVDAGYPAPGSRSYYQTLIRSSEMYLTASESYAKLGQEDSARYYLNAIRKRANSTILNVTATGTALIDSIAKERRKELCFEGLRMSDLLRTGKGVNRQDAPNAAAKTLAYPSAKAIAPIPVQDVNLSNLPQNIGY